MLRFVDHSALLRIVVVMAHDSRKIEAIQHFAHHHQNVAVRAVVAPSIQFVAQSRQCVHAMCSGHCRVAVTQFTSAVKTLFALIVNPKAGANRNY